MRLELLLLDWFFNDDDDAVCTSFLNGAVDVLAIKVMLTIAVFMITSKMS